MSAKPSRDDLPLWIRELLEAIDAMAIRLDEANVLLRAILEAQRGKAKR